MITKISGGVCAAVGFTAAGIHCGIRKNKSKKDLALIFSDRQCSAAAVYTKNLVKGAPIYVTRDNLSNGTARAIICNSGNANTCAVGGEQTAKKMCFLAAKSLGIDSRDVIVASTGVIGQKLDVTPIENAMDELKNSLGKNSGDAAQAIMTTDTKEKSVAVSFNCGGKVCHLGGIAKGSGMIHPDMATMLVFITTDAAVSANMLKKALSEDVQATFNMVSIDGDTSTNDMVAVMANGASGAGEITCQNDDYAEFCRALNAVTTALCKMIAADGEGATKMLECEVTGAVDEQTAKTAAKSVICSSLVKAAMFGADANWGRVLCAIGYSGANVDTEKIDVSFNSKKGEIAVCQNGKGIDFSEEKAKEILKEDEITIKVNLNSGKAEAKAWGCDLTYEYVKINGEYRT